MAVVKSRASGCLWRPMRELRGVGSRAGSLGGWWRRRWGRLSMGLLTAELDRTEVDEG